MSQPGLLEPRPGRVDRRLCAAALLAALTAAVHLLGGGADTAAPLLASALEDVPRMTLYGCWHVVSVTLSFSAAALLWAALPRHRPRAGPLVAFVSLLWLAFGLLFFTIAVLQPGEGWFLKLPQPILVIPVGALGLWSRLGRTWE